MLSKALKHFTIIYNGDMRGGTQLRSIFWKMGRCCKRLLPELSTDCGLSACSGSPPRWWWPWTPGWAPAPGRAAPPAPSPWRPPPPRWSSPGHRPLEFSNFDLIGIHWYSKYLETMPTRSISLSKVPQINHLWPTARIFSNHSSVKILLEKQSNFRWTHCFQ